MDELDNEIYRGVVSPGRTSPGEARGRRMRYRGTLSDKELYDVFT